MGLVFALTKPRSITNMYDFKPDPALSPAERYRQLYDAADALTTDEPDAVANMANIAALLWEFVPDLNWAGLWPHRLTDRGATDV